MIPRECKRLAEVDFPIAPVSRHSVREKEARCGHIPKLHIWPAARPGAACRAVLMALLLPDPRDANCPEDFKLEARKALRPVPGIAEPKDDNTLRKALLTFIADFADGGNSTEPTYFNAARALVRAAHGDEPPLVVDPFAGGGAIPLEALRAGCEAFASDLNPVACLIQKVVLDDIQRLGVDLVDELRRVSVEVKAAAEKELSEFYPSDSDGARPIAYLWARTVRCESPNCGAEIPLVRSCWLVKNPKRRRALRYRVKRQKEKGKTPEIEFEIFEPQSENDVPKGTVSRANATCPCCNVVLPAARVRAQLSAQRGGADVMFDKKGSRSGGARLLAVVTLKPNGVGRHYRLPRATDYAPVRATQREVARLPEGTVPNEPSPLGGGSGAGRAFSVRKYGMDTWGDLFTARQALALIRFAELIRRAETSDNSRRLLALCFDKMVDMNTALCTWQPHAEIPAHMLQRYAIPMRWDFAESVPVAESSGSIRSALKRSLECMSSVRSVASHGTIELANACASPLPDDACGVWFTDPPYYDAVPYADLSDFFLVWLQRSLPLEPLLRNPFEPGNALSPKCPEIVQDETREVDGGVKDRDFFERRMAVAFAEGRRVLAEDGVGCVVFAHKTTEGWEALLSGMLRAGWVITASWPITTEMSSRLRARDSAALAASVHLVCRPRPEDAPVGGWEDILRELPARIGDWMERLASERIRGADLVFSCIGPAMELFSRHPRVETAEGRTVELPEFLERVWEVVGRTALQQILGTEEARARNSAAGALEEDARLTALFLWTLQASANAEEGKSEKAKGESEQGDEEKEELEDEEQSAVRTRKSRSGYALIYDIARRFAQPLGIHLEEWEGRIIQIEKGVVRLLAVSERAEQLFGKEGAAAVAEAFERGQVRDPQMLLFPEDEGTTAVPKVKGRSKKAKKEDAAGASRREPTTLDRVHAAMLLQASGQSAALRAMLGAEQDRGPDFMRLANALSALYPKNSEEKRLLDAMLLAAPRR